ncbi:MAG: hypothetical protein R2762_21285 [Bryobacteraceae bacterium]
MGFVIQKEILRRRGFNNVVMRRSRAVTMDAQDLRELDQIMELLRPHFRA